MDIKAIRSDPVYREIAAAPPAEKEEIFRQKLMAPFVFKWQCVGAPLKGVEPGGYDAVAAAVMGGALHPARIDAACLGNIDAISDNRFWDACEDSIRRSLSGFEENGIALLTQNYIFTVLLNDPQSPMAP